MKNEKMVCFLVRNGDTRNKFPFTWSDVGERSEEFEFFKFQMEASVINYKKHQIENACAHARDLCISFFATVRYRVVPSFKFTFSVI